jgi:nucleotide-binding universal stress UspA family protein
VDNLTQEKERIMIRSILVPLDLSTFGEHALPMALGVARRAHASIRLLHVLQPFAEIVPELSAYPLLEAEIRQDRQKYLDGVIHRIRETSEVPVTTEIVEGAIAPSIRRAAENGTDLVVMTTHGRGPLGRFWLGSVADQLVRELTIPLLLIHPPKESADFRQEPTVRNILIPMDGTPFSEKVLSPAVELAKAMGAGVTLFRAVQVDLPLDFEYRYSGAFVPAQLREMQEELKKIQARQKQEAEDYMRGAAERVQSMGVTVSVKVSVNESPAAAILRETEEGHDLVALATHGYGGLKRLWVGSVADKVIRGSAVPVLVQHPQ